MSQQHTANLIDAPKRRGRIGLALQLTCLAACIAATPAASAQPTLSGSYGFIAVVNEIDSGGESGGAILGVMKFDGSGGLSGTYIIKERTGETQEPKPLTGAFTGSYDLKSNGTATATMDFDFGENIKINIALADGGQTLYVTDAPGSTAGTGNTGFNLNFFGAVNSPGRLTANLPASLLIPGATGTIPASLSATQTDAGLVYTLATPATASGSATCPDGSPGKWTVSIPVITAVVQGERLVSGNFLLSRRITRCDQDDTGTVTGYATGGPNAQGDNYVFTLRVTGNAIIGYGKAIGDTPADPNGAYAMQTTGSPFPAASVGAIVFDGAGAITSAVLSNAGGSNPSAGTYAGNGDGTGTMTMTFTNNPNAVPATFAYIAVDNGAGFLMLRTSGGANGGNVATYIARRQ